MTEKNPAIHGGDVYGREVRRDFSVSVNPLGTPPTVGAALVAAVAKVGAYPDLFQRDFRERVAAVDGVLPSQVWGGNGASEFFPAIVDLLNPKRALLWSPCFSGYRRALAALRDCEIVEYPLSERDGFALTDAALDAIDDAVDVVFWANPNNPTGRVVPASLTDRLLDRCATTGTAVVVDESFLRLADGAKSVRRRVSKYPKLFVVDSFTKLFAIPGARVGYLVSREENIEKVAACLPEWNLSTFAAEAGRECLNLIESGEFLEESRRAICEERRYLTAALRALGLRVYDSDANFLLFYCPAQNLTDRLLEKKILIRDCRNFSGLSEGYYRIAVLDREKNAVLVAALAELLGESHEI